MINQSFIWQLGSLTNHNASIEIFKHMYPIRSNFQDKFRASKHTMIGKCISVFSALHFPNNNFVCCIGARGVYGAYFYWILQFIQKWNFGKFSGNFSHFGESIAV